MVAAVLPAVTAAPTAASGHVSPLGKRIGGRGGASSGSGGDRRRDQHPPPHNDWKGKGKRVEGWVDVQRKAVGTGPVAEGCEYHFGG